jgi:hypothetical protein
MLLSLDSHIRTDLHCIDLGLILRLPSELIPRSQAGTPHKHGELPPLFLPFTGLDYSRFI